MHSAHHRAPRTWRLHTAVLTAVLLVLTLTPLASAQAATSAPGELVVNGDFSKGSQGWRVNKPAAHSLGVESVGPNGSAAAVLRTSDLSTVVLNDALDSVKNAAKGTSYTLSAWVRADKPNAVASVKARESAAGGSYTHEKRVKLSSTSWTQITLEFTTRFAGSTLDINVLFWGYQSRSLLSVDSVSLVDATAVVPPVEPAPPTQPVPPTNPEPGLPAQPGTPEKCTRPAPTGTQFGSSISTGSQSHAQALAEVDGLFGKLPIVRVFDPGMPFAWTHSRAPMIAGRDLVLSFRPMPQDVLSGKHDAEFRRWFTEAPADVTIYWSYIHEPEPMIDQGKFTADQYRRAWQRIDAIADEVCKKNMYPTLILTQWTTVAASKRDWRTYYPGADVIDVMAFDPYNGVHDPTRDYYASPADLFDSVVRVAQSAGKPYAIAETGSRKIPSDATGSKRAEWLNAVADYSRKNGALFVTYFHSTRDADWRLLDGPSKEAWRQAVLSSR
ncbi:carbohydrate binding domain-containing protein [Microbacterium sp. RU33B]|uniref:carbohydrate binding domain-containing protein n=1 Tax=Microbacterium sp. RU33B TaxID=1907390 RepID=UPI00095E64FA|nr:carbohydrate binding domain-containing protein [Microbacterium sp. RU33B]SIT84294.1 Carbohydrate binding domain-containing protein [Microbacterium sp. RU33B]